MKAFVREWLSEIKQFFDYLQLPKHHFDQGQTASAKVKTFASLFLLNLLFTFLVYYPLYYLVDWLYHLKPSKALQNYDIYTLLLLAVWVVPFFEEVAFRFPLKYRFNLLFRLFDLFSPSKFFKRLQHHYFPAIFYLSAAIFGLAHAMNYDNQMTFVFALLVPFLIVSQFFTGLILGYLRVRLGFFWGFLFHAVWNFLFIITAYLQHSDKKTIDIADRNKRIELTQLFISEGPKSAVTYDIRNEKVYLIDIQNGDIQLLLNQIAPQYHADDIQLVNFKVESKSGISKKDLFKILNEKIELDSIQN